MELVEPSVKYKDSFIGATKEYLKDSDMRTNWYRELSMPELETRFEDFVAREISHKEGKNLEKSFVPQTELWLIDADEYIGSVSIRHRLNDHLMQIGGHIGYDVRPGKRGKGYGNKILELALSIAKEMGIERVLMTCDVTNEPSKRVIERNGGVFENEVPNPETGIGKLRYWIDLT